MLSSSRKTPLRNDCKAFDLIINGRFYPSKELAELNMSVAIHHRGAGIARGGVGFGVEARFDIALLSRLEEHAPTLRLRTCGGDWSLTPLQVEAFRKLKRAYEALQAGK